MELETTDTIQIVDIEQQMRSAYLDYAMSVIVSRALPDARDGLKPVHRRILYAMQDLGIRHNTAFKKSARIVGEVLGKYHPHGDLAVYDAMARMAQDFSMRYMLVDGQGNFGSIDGDSPAAMRYTEARLGALAEEMLLDLDKDTVDFVPNFDGTLEEPFVLPSRLPNLLLNGSSGIAVGMATNIPPHNLRELCDTAIYIIEHYEQLDEVSVDDLMRLLPGPDFPTGGEIIGREAIRQMYSTGRARLTVRGKATVEEIKNNRFAIIISEIPYQVNKTSLIERIAELVREDKIDSISDLRDESDRKGMSIVIELKRGAQPKKVLNQLYKFTPLQTTFGAHVLALVNQEPRSLSLKRALSIYIDHRQEVITRRSRFELRKARQRAHILDGLLIALANIDAVIALIRAAKDADTARTQLMEQFGLTEIQAQAILEIQLRRLAALERFKIEEEHRDILAKIAHLETLLASPQMILDVIKDDLIELRDKYGDKRRTAITHAEAEVISEDDLVEDEQILITITERGYMKRVAAKAFRTQSRGGRGVTGQAVKEEDEVSLFIPARTLDTILFFSDRGKVYSEKAHQLPDAGRADRGAAIVNVLALDAGEKITAVLPVADFSAGQYCTMATRNGRVKRIPLSEFEKVRTTGKIAIGLDNGDELGWVRLTNGKNEIILVSSHGQALRFSETHIRPSGTSAAGVTGMDLKNKDTLAALEVLQPDSWLLTVTEGGYGKRTPLAEYPVKGRATGGVSTTDQKNQDKIGKVAAARVIQATDEVSLISASGIVIRLKMKDISETGRATRGVRLMDIEDGDRVASVAILPPTPV